MTSSVGETVRPHREREYEDMWATKRDNLPEIGVEIIFYIPPFHMMGLNLIPPMYKHLCLLLFHTACVFPSVL